MALGHEYARITAGRKKTFTNGKFLRWYVPTDVTHDQSRKERHGNQYGAPCLEEVRDVPTLDSNESACPS